MFSLNIYVMACAVVCCFNMQKATGIAPCGLFITVQGVCI
ncbi:hypothetical protein FLA_3854 [Filimonas lacunae]|nr:hypothetical protein FLA_3854 [Filimonas lacunae]